MQSIIHVDGKVSSILRRLQAGTGAPLPEQTGTGAPLPEQTAGMGNAGVDAIIADEGWVLCPFQDEQHMYRQPKQGSFLGKGSFATVYW